MMQEKNAVAAAIRAWKTSRFVQVGASAPNTAIITKQKDSSSNPLTRPYKGPISMTPTMVDGPIQINIVDISAVFDDVRTSMSGSVVTSAPTLMLCTQQLLDFYDLSLDAYNAQFSCHRT